MSPRPYSMRTRSAAVEQTRRRIVEAAMAAHAELGIAATSVHDVAERADVAVGTVYRHFPRLEDLVAACGGAARELLDLPTRDRVVALFRGVRRREDRVERLISEVARLYEPGAIGFVRLREARETLSYLAQAHEEWEGAIDALVDEALRPLRVGDRKRREVRALLDARLWQVLAERGLSTSDAEMALQRLVLCVLAGRGGGQPGGRQPPVSPR